MIRFNRQVIFDYLDNVAGNEFIFCFSLIINEGDVLYIPVGDVTSLKPPAEPEDEEVRKKSLVKAMMRNQQLKGKVILR